LQKLQVAAHAEINSPNTQANTIANADQRGYQLIGQTRKNPSTQPSNDPNHAQILHRVLTAQDFKERNNIIAIDRDPIVESGLNIHVMYMCATIHKCSGSLNMQNPSAASLHQP